LKPQQKTKAQQRVSPMGKRRKPVKDSEAALKKRGLTLTEAPEPSHSEGNKIPSTYFFPFQKGLPISHHHYVCEGEEVQHVPVEGDTQVLEEGDNLTGDSSLFNPTRHSSLRSL